MSWRYVLADLSGANIGELRAYERQFNPGVSAAATASCRIRQDDPLWAEVGAGTANLKVYDSGGALRLYGPIVGDDEQAQGQGAQMKISAADLAWELGRRYIAKDSTGVGVTYTAQDSGAIARDVLSKVNADRATGITAGTSGTFVTRTVTYLWKRAIDAINELGSLAGSYEWGLRYTDGATGGTPTVQLDLLAELGADKTDDVFLEYGTGKLNCKQYGRVSSIDQQATRVWVVGSGSTSAAQAYDTAAESTYAARREDVISFGDISVFSLLDALASEHVAVRKDPRVLVSLTPFPKAAPKYGVDYVVGDSVSARVVVNGAARVDGAVRVWGAQISIDELGNEQPALTLVPS